MGELAGKTIRSGAAAALLAEYRQRERMQAGSLLVSIFGDSVVPRGGRIWLGSLIRLLEPLGLNERLVRTAVFRLVKSDWLLSERVGRRTDYLLTTAAARRIEEAAGLIYAATAPAWDRRWRLMLLVGEVGLKERERLRKALSWHGFGMLNNDCFIHPNADLQAAMDALAAEGLAGLGERLKPLLAADVSMGAALTDRAMVAAAWDLEALAADYHAFVRRFEPVLDELRASAGGLDGELAFQMRLLLIHDYRHLLLRDPVLPDVLLPLAWPGQQARSLCGELYRRLLPAAERYLDSMLQLADGERPLPQAGLFERFRDADALALCS